VVLRRVAAHHALIFLPGFPILLAEFSEKLH